MTVAVAQDQVRSRANCPQGQQSEQRAVVEHMGEEVGQNAEHQDGRYDARGRALELEADGCCNQEQCEGAVADLLNQIQRKAESKHCQRWHEHQQQEPAHE